MGWFAEMKTYLHERRFCRQDLILIVALLICSAILYMAWSGGIFATRLEYPVSQGYQARLEDGWVYLLDSGHSCLTKASPDGRIVYRVSPGLYVDSFSVGDDGSVCLNASAFGGMTVVGEQVLTYDSNGKNMKVVAEKDYGDGYLSKHALHGVSERNGMLRYIECRDGEIVSHCVDLRDLRDTESIFPYPNAFNAVSDAGFDGEILYVLDRNGTLLRFSAGGEAEQVYSVGEAGEAERVPYRLTVSDAGEVFFTDIRSRSVQRVDLENGRSETVVADTDSVTAGVTGAGAEAGYALTCEDMVWLPDGSVLTSFRNSAGPVALFCAAILLAVLTALIAVVLLLRVIFAIPRRKRTGMQRTMLAVVVVGLFTTFLTGSVLISGFRKAYTDKINEELIVCSVMTANSIRADDVLSINKAEDYGSDAYLRVSAAMENSFDRNVDFNRNAYCNIVRYDGEGCAYCIAYLDGTIGTYYPLGAYETADTVTVYETKQPVISDEFKDISGIYLGVKVPILDADGACVGVVSSGTQVVLLQELLRSMIFRVLTSILFFAIMVWFLVSEVFAYVRNADSYRTALAERPAALPGHTFRLMLVLVFAAYNLQAAFLPGYIVHQLPEGSENAALLASLPYTVNIFLVGITAIFCAKLVRNIGLVPMLVISLAAAFAGNLLIFFVPGYMSMLAGMALIGVGVGLLTNTMYVLLTYVNDSNDQVWGLSLYNAAVMAGINLGMVGGSLLAVWLGQRMVFAVSAGLWLLILLLSGGLVRRMSAAISIPEKQTVQKVGGSFRSFFCNRVIPGFMVCIQNPYIIFSSFVMYYLPIFSDTRGYSETSTALMLLCYAELSILMGDAMVERSRRLLGNGAMYAALGIDVAALLLFALTQNLAGMLIALLLLGLSASFGKPVQQKYFIDLPQVKAYGEDRAMGIYNFSENIGESAGPIIMAWLMFRTPLFPAVAGFCGIVAALSAIHAAIVPGEKKKRS